MLFYHLCVSLLSHLILTVRTAGKATNIMPNVKSHTPSYLLYSRYTSHQHSGANTNRSSNLSHKKGKGKPATTDTYTSPAQLTGQHSPGDLEDRLVMTLINFPRKQIGKVMSGCLVVGVLPGGEGVGVRRSGRGRFMCGRLCVLRLRRGEW